MDYFTSQAMSPLMLGDNDERRRSPRKRLQRRVSVGLTKGEIIQGHTVEVSIGGLALVLPKSIKIGEKCAVRFDMLVDGVAVKVAGIGKVANCVCSGQDFRIGMEFHPQDAHAVKVVAAYVEQQLG